MLRSWDLSQHPLDRTPIASYSAWLERGMELGVEVRRWNGDEAGDTQRAGPDHGKQASHTEGLNVIP